MEHGNVEVLLDGYDGDRTLMTVGVVARARSAAADMAPDRAPSQQWVTLTGLQEDWATAERRGFEAAKAMAIDVLRGKDPTEVIRDRVTEKRWGNNEEA